MVNNANLPTILTADTQDSMEKSVDFWPVFERATSFFLTEKNIFQKKTRTGANKKLSEVMRPSEVDFRFSLSTSVSDMEPYQHPGYRQQNNSMK